MKCIIIGGSGFIGTHLQKKLIELNIFTDILIIDLVEPKKNYSNVKYLHADIRKKITINLDSQYTVCFHLAALCKEPGFQWDDYFTTNHIGTINVCHWLEKNNIKNLIFTSTMMTFRAGEKYNNEESLTSPDTAYGISKLLAENYICRWHETDKNRRIINIRLGVVFGQWEKGNYTRLYYALKKHRFAYIGKKTTIKGSMYVKDVVDFILLTLNDQADYDLYNLAYLQPTTIQEICESFKDTFGFNGYIPTIPYRLALLMGYTFEFLSILGLKTNIHHRRIQKLYQSTNISSERAYKIGFTPKFTLREALQDWKKDCLPKDIH